jgi:2-methylaconitate cis-trans-isomerase PrpF
VSFDTAFIDYNSNFGNVSSGVGPFAIDEWLGCTAEPIPIVRIRMANCNKILVAVLPVKDGKAKVEGDFAMSGVPGTGTKISMDWSDVVGSIIGKRLLTGNAKDIVEVNGVKFPVSIVDTGNPVVFIINAKSLKLKGKELPKEIESRESLMETIEKIRGHGAVLCGMSDKPENAKSKRP